MQAWPLWIGFIAFVLVMMVIDLRFIGKPGEAVPVPRALKWMSVCVVLALAFAPALSWMYDAHFLGLGNAQGDTPALTGRKAAVQFLTGWGLEYSLSVDNLFVFAVIFRTFKIPPARQHRVLAWGIIAALILRGVMIGAGTYLFQRFDILIPIAGAFLIYTGFTMLGGGDDFDAQHHWSTRVLKKFLPYEDRFHGDNFFVKRPVATGGAWAMTPLFLVLIVINIVDVIFALDSIPAIFGITKDPFLVFTSNVFAILGLRSLYFAIAALMGKFDRLKYALAFILAFIGVKMILASHQMPEKYRVHIDEFVSLGVIAAALLAGVVASLYAKPHAAPGTPGTPEESAPR